MTNLQVIQEFLKGNNAQTPLRYIDYGRKRQNSTH